MRKILYVDDEPNNLFTLETALARFYNVITTEKPEDALGIISKERINVLITDQRMPKISGLELAQKVQGQHPSTMVIILTAFDDNETMLKAINQGGIFRYLLKPWNIQDLLQTLDSAFEAHELRKTNLNLTNTLLEKYRRLEDAYNEINALKEKVEEENIQLKEEFLDKTISTKIVGKSKPILGVLKQLERAAKSDSTILLLGETGTGKELFAKTAHALSPRSEKLMVTVNCAAIPETLIESELFGHEKGSFTGADKLKYGKFEIAHQGTLFLDEIGELPIGMQPKLLRVLQENEFERLGSNKVQNTDFRLIVATNRDLDSEIGKGNFRSDLFYRLNILPITIPPLREHPEDIPLLVNHFISNFNRKTGASIDSISRKALTRLMEYHWPGNIRELENVVERAHVLSPGSKLDIGDWFNFNQQKTHGVKEILPLAELEKEHILKALKHTRWRVRGINGAANLLHINPSTLESRMKKLGIERPT